ncbi:hypothetical protein M9458_058196 [Cirrhinus mrigala]|uniref:Uncharacterized protein n=1 Tax=Cirrhinus mrigala TaxID=683832 RepID=A0ABD0MCF3_CIRMR
MDPLLRPEFILLRLKQGGLPLEGYTTMFQLVAHATSYPNDALCAFYDASLNTTALDGHWRETDPRSPPVPLKNLAGATPDPEPSQPPPRHVEHAHEPTVGGKPEPSATELPVAMESELHEPSDQVREPAIVTTTVGSSVEREYAEDSITHCTTAEGELNLDLGQNVINYEQDLKISEDVVIKLPAHHELSVCVNFPPSLHPPSLPPSVNTFQQPSYFNPTTAVTCQSLCSPSAHHLCGGFAAGLPVSIGVIAGGSLIFASSLRVLDSASALRPCSSTPVLSSLVPPAPPRSAVTPPSPQDSTPPAAPRRSVPPAPWTSSLPRAQPRSSVAPATPWTSGSSVSPRIIGSPSPPRALPPPAPPPSVGPRESSACPPPWILPPLAPPWIIMAAVWVSLGSSCFRSLLSPPWLLPPSSPPWTIPSPPWTPSFALLLGVRTPPKPPPKTLYISVFPVCRRKDAPSGRGR